jgi:hypothetical protein
MYVQCRGFPYLVNCGCAMFDPDVYPIQQSIFNVQQRLPLLVIPSSWLCRSSLVIQLTMSLECRCWLRRNGWSCIPSAFRTRSCCVRHPQGKYIGELLSRKFAKPSTLTVMDASGNRGTSTLTTCRTSRSLHKSRYNFSTRSTLHQPSLYGRVKKSSRWSSWPSSTLCSIQSKVWNLDDLWSVWQNVFIEI